MVTEKGVVQVDAGALGFHGQPFPALIRAAGPKAARRFVEFFTAHIRNPNTRAAYARAVSLFCAWCTRRGFALHDIEPITVAAYVERLGRSMSRPTVKQHLAALRMLFDHLVTGQILATNPAASVRGPKHVVKRGKTPVLSPEDARLLLDSIDCSKLIGLRDRALIALMVYSFARISAAVGMSVQDYCQNGKRWWIRLNEKGGKFHEVPAHRQAEDYLDAYLKAACIGCDPKSPSSAPCPASPGS